MFFTAMTFINFNLSNVIMNNQECKIRTKIINLNTNQPMFYPCFIVLKLIDAKAVVIQSMTHMLKYVSLTKLKTQM